MISMRKVANFMGAEPFRPFRIRMTTGRTIVISNPEMIFLGLTSVRIYLDPEDEGYESKQTEDISLELVDSIEPVVNVASRT